MGYATNGCGMRSPVGERPKNRNGSYGMPKNFPLLRGWTREDLAAFLIGRGEPVSVDTIRQWELQTGNRLDRVCDKCGKQRKHKDVRQVPNGFWCIEHLGREARRRARAEQKRRERPTDTLRKAIAGDVEAFLANGGQITVGPAPHDPKHPRRSESLRL